MRILLLLALIGTGFFFYALFDTQSLRRNLVFNLVGLLQTWWVRRTYTPQPVQL